MVISMMEGSRFKLKIGDIMLSFILMAQLIVRNLENDIRDRIRALAELHGCSMEEEVRQILRSAVLASAARPALVPPLGTRMSERFARIGLTEDLPQLPPQTLEPPSFGRGSSLIPTCSRRSCEWIRTARWCVG